MTKFDRGLQVALCPYSETTTLVAINAFWIALWSECWQGYSGDQYRLSTIGFVLSSLLFLCWQADYLCPSFSTRYLCYNFNPSPHFA